MKRDGLRSRVHCLGGSPGGIKSRGRSALWELLLEAERERDHRPVRPNLRTPARSGTQTSACSIFFGSRDRPPPSSGGEVPQPPIVRRWQGAQGGLLQQM